jgi:hypothetical protein
MSIYGDKIEVCVANSNEDSPHKVGVSQSLIGELYCELLVALGIGSS